MTEWKETELGQMPADWDLKTVDEVKSIERKSIISGPFGSNISSKFFVPDGVPVIRGNNLSLKVGKKFIDDGFVFLTQDKANELGTWATKDDLIFTAAGTIGQVGILTGNEKYSRYIISNKQLRVRLDRTIVEPLFAYYWFASPFMTNTINGRDTGSTIPLINLSVLKGLPIPLPPLPEQQAIAGVLSRLDDKIDLLHRQNKTLEALAETLFRQWFVEESEEGWETAKIGDVLRTELGGTPSTNKPEYWDGDIAWINSGEVNKFRIIEASKFITKLGLEKSNCKLLPKGTTVLAITGATLGQVSLLEIDTCANQSVVGIVPNERISKEFVFLWVKHKIEEIIMNETGGAQPHINKNDVNETEIIIPPKDKSEEKLKTISTYFEKITKNVFQIRTLTTLRDALLPKLMSGEVRVTITEAETAIASQ